MKTLKKIRLIEEPKSEELLRQELEDALGGLNCGSYTQGGDCSVNNNGFCIAGGTNYCEKVSPAFT